MATDDIKKWIPIFLVLICLTGCYSRGSMMTYNTYDQVQIGTSITDLKSDIGRPYAIHQKDGSEEYEYVERINAGNNLIAENHYFLIVQNGKVIGKYMTRERPPAYDLIYQEEPNYPGYSP